jgi:hypothetical protein
MNSDEGVTHLPRLGLPAASWRRVNRATRPGRAQTVHRHAPLARGRGLPRSLCRHLAMVSCLDGYQLGGTRRPGHHETPSPASRWGCAAGRVLRAVGCRRAYNPTLASELKEWSVRPSASCLTRVQRDCVRMMRCRSLRGQGRDGGIITSWIKAWQRNTLREQRNKGSCSVQLFRLGWPTSPRCRHWALDQNSHHGNTLITAGKPGWHPRHPLTPPTRTI